jgi:hypothetical protein
MRIVMNVRYGSLLLLISFANTRGAPEDAFIIAAMALGEQSNYSWSTVVTDEACTYGLEGKTQRGGFTWQRQPMPKSIARRLGRSAGADLEAVFQGPSRFVIQTETGWQTLDELPRRHPEWIDQDDSWYMPVAVPAGLNSSAGGTGSFDPSLGPSIVYVPVVQERQEPPHSNYQFALSLPHEQLAIIVSSYGSLVASADSAAGTLSDLGAQLLLVHDGHEYITPLAATGRFKLWIRDGTVVRFTVELEGVVYMKKKRILVQQTATTDVRNIGTTFFTVADHLQQKLRG